MAGAYRLRMLAFYFGTLPPYIDLTLRTMAANEDIDWLIFCDRKVTAPAPNVVIRQTTFEDFRSRVQEPFDFALNVPRPYKLADTRPAFGLIFAKELEGYDLWGFSDLDILFGDITAFLTPHVVEDHDKYLLRGHFSIYPNTPEACRWFLAEGHGKTFREAMAEPLIQYWDEWVGINKIIRGLKLRVWDPMELRFDMDTHRYLPRVNYLGMRRSQFYWESGRLVEIDRAAAFREGIYMHLQKRPMLPPSPQVLSAERFWVHGGEFTADEQPRVSAMRDIRGAFEFRRSRITKGARR